MAATIPEYVDPLIRRQEVWGAFLGSSIRGSDPQTYNINLTILTMIGVVMQAMVDKGAITDAEWLARIDAVSLPGQNWQAPQNAWLLKQLPPPT